MDTSVGDDFLGFCGQQVHMTDFECLQSYDLLNRRIKVRDYWKIMVEDNKKSIYRDKFKMYFENS